MLRELEPYIRDAEMDPGLGEGDRGPDAFDTLAKQASAWLYERRRARQLARRAKLRVEHPPEAWADPDERRRARTLTAELGRLALRLGGGKDDNGEWLGRPIVVQFREDVLGGRVLAPRPAMAFMQSDALAHLSAEYFRELGIPAAEHEWRLLRQELVKSPDGYGPVEELRFEIKAAARVETPTCRFRPNSPRLRLDLPFVRPRREKEVLQRSVLGDLHRVGAKLAEHYLWDAGQSCWFVLTGELPNPPYFTMRFEGGLRHDHEQYRVNISVPLWVRGTTLVRMLKAARARYVGTLNRPLSESRLELVDFVAPLRHAGKSWSEVAKLWNKAHPRRKYLAANVRNLERNFSESYSLLLRTPLQLRIGSSSKPRSEADARRPTRPPAREARAKQPRPRSTRK